MATEPLGIGRIAGNKELETMLEQSLLSKFANVVEEQSIARKILKVDNSLVDLAGMDLPLQKFTSGQAAYGLSDISSIVATVDLPSTVTIKTYFAYAMALWGPKTEKSLSYKTGAINRALSDIARLENQVAIEGIYANKANSTSATTAGTAAWKDLTNIMTTITSAGGVPTNFIFDALTWNDILNDAKMIDRTYTPVISDPSAGALILRSDWGFDMTNGLGWAGSDITVGYDRTRYMVFAQSLPLQMQKIDKTLTGSGFTKGVLFYEAFGVALDVDGAKFVGYVDQSP